MVLLAILDSPKDALLLQRLLSNSWSFTANGFYVFTAFGRKWLGAAQHDALQEE